ncbi:DUF2149 domain-containing protein [uncultured Xylophilus sp.]|uniref:DUF2149 domain-containing protein n=1 Tax=uncultured Xylophilus sp. TaxID=296832 RepID=UPI0025E6178E|nr:DUF2149 domain-containing protein [uncultured Xylophilus sp.]
MKHLSVLAEEDDDPMLSAINLIDVFLVLVVALLTAVAVQSQSADGAVTAVRNPGQPDMELTITENGKAVRFKGTGSASRGQGVRTGVAYRLDDGSVVYVPEPGAGGAGAAPATNGPSAAPAAGPDR